MTSAQKEGGVGFLQILLFVNKNLLFIFVDGGLGVTKMGVIFVDVMIVWPLIINNT